MPPVATSKSTVGGAPIIATGYPVLSRSGIHAIVGDAVMPHGIGPHASAVMVQGSGVVKIKGIPVCREGDLASCGHCVDWGTGEQNIIIPL